MRFARWRGVLKAVSGSGVSAEDRDRRWAHRAKGHLPERQMMTGWAWRCAARVRDGRWAPTKGASASRRQSCAYARRSRASIHDPILYLKVYRLAIRAGAGRLARQGCPVVGHDHRAAEGGWTDEHKRWSERDLSAKSTSTSGPTVSTCRRAGSRGTMHPGHHRRHAGGQEGAARLVDGGARALKTGACCSISSAGVCRWH